MIYSQFSVQSHYSHLGVQSLHLSIVWYLEFVTHSLAFTAIVHSLAFRVVMIYPQLRPSEPSSTFRRLESSSTFRRSKPPFLHSLVFRAIVHSLAFRTVMISLQFCVQSHRSHLGFQSHHLSAVWYLEPLFTVWHSNPLFIVRHTPFPNSLAFRAIVSLDWGSEPPFLHSLESKVIVHSQAFRVVGQLSVQNHYIFSSTFRAIS